jgi:hypothetical protein
MAGGPADPASLVDRLRSPEAERRVDAMAELAVRPLPAADEELNALVACLEDERKLVQRRAAESLAALHRRGADVVAKVCSLLTAGAHRARWGSAYALSLIDALELEALEPLAESLAVDDRDLRWAAVDLLRKLAARHPDAVVGRAVALGSAGSPVQRRMAFYLLRDVAAGEPAVRRAALDALGCSDPNLRLAALAVLAAAGAETDEEVDGLTALVGDPDLPVARAAAATLGSVRRPPPVVLETLRAARRHADPSLRRAAASALRRLEEQGREE